MASYDILQQHKAARALFGCMYFCCIYQVIRSFLRRGRLLPDLWCVHVHGRLLQRHSELATCDLLVTGDWCMNYQYKVPRESFY